jgi:hypothetical protein
MAGPTGAILGGIVGAHLGHNQNPDKKCLDRDPLDLVEGDLVRGTVVELGGSGDPVHEVNVERAAKSPTNLGCRPAMAASICRNVTAKDL